MKIQTKSLSRLILSGLCLLAAGMVLAPKSAEAACSDPAGVEGQVKYNATHKTMVFCDGTDWWAMKAGSGGAGIDSTMVQGWPDAIVCDVTSLDLAGGKLILSHAFGPTTSNQIAYTHAFNTDRQQLRFNTDGTYATNSGPYTLANCNKSITQLYDDGQAFNFIGKGQRNFTCPSGFTMIEAQGRQLGCMQDDEEGTGTWYASTNTCFTTYGGRLPSATEWYLAMNNYTLLNETGNWEWLDQADKTTGVDFAVIGNSSIENSNNRTGTVSNAYRCFIPPH